MSKAKDQTNEKVPSLIDLALSQTKEVLSSNNTGRGGITHLDRFVKILLDENGKPTEPKTRDKVKAEMALEICIQKRESEKEENPELDDFNLTTDEDKELFARVVKKCNNQLAACVANNKNNTSLSYNKKYKDVWVVVKDGNKISLAPVEKTED